MIVLNILIILLSTSTPALKLGKTMVNIEINLKNKHDRIMLKYVICIILYFK